MAGVRLLQQGKQETKRTVCATSFPMEESQFFRRYKKQSRDRERHVLLESGRGGRYSMVGLEPVMVLEGKKDTLIVTTENEVVKRQGALLDLMRDALASYQAETLPGAPPFQGGAIGFCSYDLVREIERLPTIAQDDLNLPDLYFLIFDDVFIYDHEKKVAWIFVHGDASEQDLSEQKLRHYEATWKQPVSLDEEVATSYLETEGEKVHSFSEETFAKAVERVREYIAAGDVFQVNLSVREGRPLRTTPLSIYEALRQINPSPYMSYLHTPDFQLVSGSPELLIKKDGRKLSTRPIAGTRSRGATADEDEALVQTLLSNEKERAEHVMLVDLERNDLGRVSEYGSVEVNELMVVEKYSHVMHIVSNVRGVLKEGLDAFDAIRATFPGGTITGAPKVRTMEIIEELEPVRRGIYTGSIGWIGYNGDMELNIVIRTMLCKDEMAYVQAGAGVVIDSNPRYEYKESLKKAKALWRAYDQSIDEQKQRIEK